MLSASAARSVTNTTIGGSSGGKHNLRTSSAQGHLAETAGPPAPSPPRVAGGTSVLTMDRCIYLIGLMGSGKSTVGHLLAQRIGCEYVDNDATIAQLAGRSTVALAEAGGSLLHDWESRYISHVRALPPPAVVGIPASTSENRDDLQSLRDAGLLVYLRCDVDTLVQRVTAGPSRPWLTGHVRDTIEAMHARRDPALCAAAERTIDATLPIAVIVDALYPPSSAD